MKRSLMLLGLSLGLVAGCSQLGGSDESALGVNAQSQPVKTVVDDDGDEEDVSLGEVPDVAKDAAVAAVPGLVLEEAEREGADAFCLHGHADGEFYEVEVSSAGTVIAIEHGDEDDDDGPDDDDDDANGDD